MYGERERLSAVEVESGEPAVAVDDFAVGIDNLDDVVVDPLVVLSLREGDGAAVFRDVGDGDRGVGVEPRSLAAVAVGVGELCAVVGRRDGPARQDFLVVVCVPALDGQVRGAVGRDDDALRDVGITVGMNAFVDDVGFEFGISCAP